MGDCCRFGALAEEALESGESFRWFSGEFVGEGSVTGGAHCCGGLGIGVGGVFAGFGE